jgi:hypothetical protein
VVSILTPAEVLIAARRLAGARPHLAAVAAIVHNEDLWRLCRDELTGRKRMNLSLNPEPPHPATQCSRTTTGRQSA